MNNSNILSITMNLTGWPAAVTCGIGFLVIGGTTVLLGSKLIDNGYQLTNTKGVSITTDSRKPSVEPEVSCASKGTQPMAA